MKRGFTLIELIGVIVILGIIISIVYPIINSSFNSTTVKISTQQISALEDAARIWGVKNLDQLSEDQPKYLTIDELKRSGIIENKSVLDTETMESITGCIKIEYDALSNQYSYKYGEYGEQCE